VRVYWTPIFHFVLASVRDRHLAEDLTQDCFWNAYKGWDRFRGESSVGTWLRRIALNVIRTFLHRERGRPWQHTLRIDPNLGDQLPSAGRLPEAEILTRDTVRAIWKAAARLSPGQRTALQLRFRDDLSVAEIARAMNLTEGAVKVQLFRAVHSLRTRLEA
jgi:RNA polymerase sigma-70 factor (ECF subfamily)